ncbi:reverse transcriptase domain-containing protein, partial [Tanacetum coccineum]
GTEGVVGLSRWFEKMESVFHISGCAIDNQVKFATALTASQRTITCYECGNQRHYRSDCPVLKNQDTEARGMMYALGGGETDQDINNMEDDINALTLSPQKVLVEPRKQTTHDSRIPFKAHDRIVAIQRTFYPNSGRNDSHIIQEEESEGLAQDVQERKLTDKYCQNGEIKETFELTVESKGKYIWIGLLDTFLENVMVSKDPKTLEFAIETITCYECGNQGHYKSDCPMLKNQGTEARGMVYTLGGGETNQDLDNTEDDISA